MGTRSNIALVKKGGAVEAVYCQHDGYPEGIGKTLAKRYDTEEEVAALLELGAIWILRGTLKTCVFFRRDFGGRNTEENTRAERYASLAECVAAQDGNVDIEWLYLFADDRWWVRPLRGDGFYRLADMLDACNRARARAERARPGMRLFPITMHYAIEEIMDEHGVRPRAFTGASLRGAGRPTEGAALRAPEWAS